MERSILFSPTMARAIMTGKKTVTRRTISARSPPQCPYGPAGRHLWLKEDFYAYGRWEISLSLNTTRLLWRFIDLTRSLGKHYEYSPPADYIEQPRAESPPAWWHRPGRLMPRQASRATLEVTEIHTEHLHDITNEQAQAEGFYPIHDSTLVYFANHLQPPHIGLSPTPVIAFACWWEQARHTSSWSDNPRVWVISFRKL